MPSNDIDHPCDAPVETAVSKLSGFSTGHAVPGKVIRFIVVGGTGFVIDAALLVTLHAGFGIDPYTARIVAISVAMIVTWRLNRAFTFGSSQTGQAHEALRYGLVGGVAAWINWLVYAACMYFAGLAPLVALATGVVAGMVVNFTGYDRFVFRQQGGAGQ